MSETGADSQSAEDHAYFRAIEEVFIRLRGAPLLLSPADWRVAREWRRAGIPLAVVHQALEEVFAGRAARDEEAPVRTLRYVRRAVEGAWKATRELTAGGERGPAETIDLPARLGRLAGSLPGSLPGAAEVAARITRLEGTSEEVESQLAALDEELLRLAETAASAATLAAAEAHAERALETLQDRLSAAESGAAEERLRRQDLRRRSDLPVLSLFSPEAQASPEAQVSPETPGSTD